MFMQSYGQRLVYFHISKPHLRLKRSQPKLFSLALPSYLFLYPRVGAVH